MINLLRQKRDLELFNIERPSEKDYVSFLHHVSQASAMLSTQTKDKQEWTRDNTTFLVKAAYKALSKSAYDTNLICSGTCQSPIRTKSFFGSSTTINNSLEIICREIN